jgi:hypothetical protein
MEWADFIPIVLGVLAAVAAVPAFLRLVRKGSPAKQDELQQHLAGIGLKVSRVEKDSEEDTAIPKNWGEKSEGAFIVADRNVDAVAIRSVSSQYGTNYYLDYVVRHPGVMAAESKKTTLIKRKRPPVTGKVVDIEWKGASSLAQRLNYDYSLTHRLLDSGPDGLKVGITIQPLPKHGCTRIRTGYRLPSADLFQAIDTIARHVKAGV